jgi:phage portal protein BeeE
MAFLKNIRGLFGQRSERPQRSDVERENVYPLPDKREALAAEQLYDLHPALGAVIDDFVETAACAEFKVYYRDSQDDEVEIPNHPFVQLLNDPNVEDTRFEFLSYTFWHQFMGGNAYWLLRGNAQGELTDMFNLDPSSVRRDPRSSYPWGYQYMVSGREKFYSFYEICHHRFPTYRDLFYGEGKVGRVEKLANLDLAMIDTQWSMFRKSVAIPAVVVHLPRDMQQKPYDEFKREFKALFARGSGSDGTAFVRDLDESTGVKGFVERVGLIEEEASYNVSREKNIEGIMMGVGAALGMYSKTSTEAHSRVAQGRFLSRLWRLLVMNQQAISKHILPLMGTGIYGRYVDPRLDEMRDLLLKAQAAEKVPMTADEKRAVTFGLEPIENFGEDVNAFINEST